ncbi:MAG: hypothetical protein CYG61_08475 [Actinobacteria bacterium]|nr:MAG: hypothetical protein CYG61_08475 [Actinomycetota bacterium]
MLAVARQPARKRFRAAPFGFAAAVLLAGACSGGSDGVTSGSTSTTARTGTGAVSAPAPAPAGSPEEALTALLTAEKMGDHAASFRLLSASARKELNLSRWARRRSEVPAVTGFRIEGTKGAVVTAVVEHEPGLDPFVGLRPGEERQVWKARQEGGGWLLEAEPSVKPLFPPAERATEAALAWVRAVQACDQKAVADLQGVDELFGMATAVATLCRSPATPTAGPPARLPAGFASQALVAQYGPETFDWARTVAISSVDRPFHVVLAPIGSVWKVVGVYEP